MNWPACFVPRWSEVSLSKWPRRPSALKDKRENDELFIKRGRSYVCTQPTHLAIFSEENVRWDLNSEVEDTNIVLDGYVQSIERVAFLHCTSGSNREKAIGGHIRHEGSLHCQKGRRDDTKAAHGEGERKQGNKSIIGDREKNKENERERSKCFVFFFNLFLLNCMAKSPIGIMALLVNVISTNMLPPCRENVPWISRPLPLAAVSHTYKNTTTYTQSTSLVNLLSKIAHGFRF